MFRMVLPSPPNSILVLSSYHASDLRGFLLINSLVFEIKHSPISPNSVVYKNRRHTSRTHLLCAKPQTTPRTSSNSHTLGIRFHPHSLRGNRKFTIPSSPPLHPLYHMDPPSLQSSSSTFLLPHERPSYADNPPAGFAYHHFGDAEISTLTDHLSYPPQHNLTFLPFGTPLFSQHGNYPSRMPQVVLHALAYPSSRYHQDVSYVPATASRFVKIGHFLLRLSGELNLTPPFNGVDQRTRSPTRC